MSEQNKALVRQFIEEFEKRKALPEELIDQNFATHIAGFPSMDLAGYKVHVSGLFTAFPDFKHDIEDLIAEGDKVACRTTLRGTHKGEMMGIAATGKEVTFSRFAIYRISGGKIVEEWAIPDAMGLMQQIGAIH